MFVTRESTQLLVGALMVEHNTSPCLDRHPFILKPLGRVSNMDLPVCEVTILWSEHHFTLMRLLRIVSEADVCRCHIQRLVHNVALVVASEPTEPRIDSDLKRLTIPENVVTTCSFTLVDVKGITGHRVA